VKLRFGSPFAAISDLAWSFLVGIGLVILSLCINSTAGGTGWWLLLVVGLPMAVWGGSIIGHNLARYQSEKR
jgi:hypothetical protein